ncbi:arrestin domain-containing protein 17-like [Gigantopelta aegis]|uniref:arrestin domain-containing protein 17-like n=1 Tax=Gigantopelta aegis TaxID=1735272 RepID=UPI001B88BA71|nr:arrestin domain-containing protein 17-like [Gigantopelta aegis]
MEVKDIEIKFEGVANLSWTLPDSESKAFSGSETYIDEKIVFFEAEGESLIFHPAGYHVYKFDIALPTTIPSSFEGSKGYVRYKCTAIIDRGWKGDHQEEKSFIVIHHLDLNSTANVSMPVCAEGESAVEGCCCEVGIVYAKLMLPKKGFVPGEPVDFDITIDNKSNTTVGGFSIDLRQTVCYTGYPEGGECRADRSRNIKVSALPLFEFTDGVPSQSVRSITGHATIPSTPASKLEGCNIIDINYDFTLNLGAGWNDLVLEVEIFIGTIPLREQTVVPGTAVPVLVRFPGQHVATPTVASGGQSSFPTTPDAPPSYEECLFGMMSKQAIDSEGRGQSLSRPDAPPVYPYYSDWTTATVHAVTNQPQSTSALVLHVT